MLNEKSLLAKILKLHVESFTPETATSVSANGGTAWIQVPFPNTVKPLCVCGYYLEGGSGCTVYNMALTSNYASFAVRNAQSTVNNVKVRADLLCWGGSS